MAYQFGFDPTHRILWGRLVEEVGDDELADYYWAAARLSESVLPHAALTDLSSATVSASPQTVQKLAKLPPAMRDPSRPRFIVAPSDHAFGLARMFQIAGEATRPNLHVMPSLEEVWESLGVRQLQFQPASRAPSGPQRGREPGWNC